MLEKTIVKNGNAIQEHVCIPIDKTQKHPMDRETSEILVKLSLSGDVEIPENEKPFLYKVIEKRIKHCFNYTIKDPKLIIFLCYISERPGKAILYLWYLQYWSHLNNTKEIDLTIFCTKIFPWGLVNDDDFHTIWDSQKVDRENMSSSDNLVDYASAGKSILEYKN